MAMELSEKGVWGGMLGREQKGSKTEEKRLKPQVCVYMHMCICF